MVQPPDDLDATCRKKLGESFRGQVASITGTANPDNDVNLITDVATAANNTDDDVILNERLDIIKVKTPDLKELHTDGGYGSVPNDEKMGTLGVTHVQTAVRGRKAAVPMRIEASAEEGSYKVSCPRATVGSEPLGKKYRAVFPAAACEDCPHAAKCQAGKRASQNSKSPPCRCSGQSSPLPQAAGTGPPGRPQASQPTSPHLSSTASNDEDLPCPETEKSPFHPSKPPKRPQEKPKKNGL